MNIYIYAMLQTPRAAWPLIKRIVKNKFKIFKIDIEILFLNIKNSLMTLQQKILFKALKKMTSKKMGLPEADELYILITPENDTIELIARHNPTGRQENKKIGLSESQFFGQINGAIGDCEHAILNVNFTTGKMQALKKVAGIEEMQQIKL